MPISVARTGNNLVNGNFLPEVWSRKLNAKFYANTVLNDIVNRNWEGEIKTQGSKVIIRKRPTISVGNYSVNGSISYQDLGDDKVELLLDKAKYFAFVVDDIDQAQADIAIINECTMDAGEQMSIEIDTDVLGSTYVDAATALTSTVVNKTTVLDWIIDAHTALDEKNAPKEGRWIVMPSWICGTILKSDLKDASITGDATSIARNGKVGIIANMTVYQSNNVSVTAGAPDTYHCIAGTKDAIAFAAQVTKTETVRRENTFGDAVRGLNVYGYKVVAPDALVHLPATKQ